MERHGENYVLSIRIAASAISVTRDLSAIMLAVWAAFERGVKNLYDGIYAGLPESPKLYNPGKWVWSENAQMFQPPIQLPPPPITASLPQWSDPMLNAKKRPQWPQW